uniref:tRNA (adenosine(37)-N6)-dimethylallyltransferase n=1 Tax=Streptococcus pluranimalium TaxID=82348 RepID=UPI003F69046B
MQPLRLSSIGANCLLLLVGRGLYLQSLLEGYHLGGNLDQEALLAYRQELEKEEDETIFAKVAEKGLDIPQLNRRRAIRALELAKFGQDLTNQDSDLESLLIGLTDERQVLYDRINARVDVMIANGLLEEAKWLYDHHPDVQAARGIGYKELFPYFAGQEDLETSVERLKQNTRRFAKRQLTWFRNRMSVDFYQISDQNFQEKIATRVEDFLKES